jgi:hypothetical protein
MCQHMSDRRLHQRRHDNVRVHLPERLLQKQAERDLRRPVQLPNRLLRRRFDPILRRVVRGQIRRQQQPKVRRHVHGGNVRRSNDGSVLDELHQQRDGQSAEEYGEQHVRVHVRRRTLSQSEQQQLFVHLHGTVLGRQQQPRLCYDVSVQSVDLLRHGFGRAEMRVSLFGHALRRHCEQGVCVQLPAGHLSTTP